MTCLSPWLFQRHAEVPLPWTRVWFTCCNKILFWTRRRNG